MVELLPLAHFLRPVRGILLKRNEVTEIFPNIWPIVLFMLLVLVIGRRRYRETLD